MPDEIIAMLRYLLQGGSKIPGLLNRLTSQIDDLAWNAGRAAGPQGGDGIVQGLGNWLEGFKRPNMAELGGYLSEDDLMKIAGQFDVPPEELTSGHIAALGGNLYGYRQPPVPGDNPLSWQRMGLLSGKYNFPPQETQVFPGSGVSILDEGPDFAPGTVQMAPDWLMRIMGFGTPAQSVERTFKQPEPPWGWKPNPN